MGLISVPMKYQFRTRPRRLDNGDHYRGSRNPEFLINRIRREPHSKAHAVGGEQSMTRPTTDCGDEGHFVMEIQACLDVDGDFCPLTEEAVRAFQTDQRLESDGVVDSQTWDQLEEIYGLPPYSPQLPLPLSRETVEAIFLLAMNSPVADYSWDDWGTVGYMNWA